MKSLPDCDVIVVDDDDDGDGALFTNNHSLENRVADVLLAALLCETDEEGRKADCDAANEVEEEEEAN